MKFFLKCDEAASVCDKSQYKEIGFFDKLMLKVHLLMCKLCRSYSKKNVELTKTIKSANLKTLSLQDKQRLKKKLEEEINKNKSF